MLNNMVKFSANISLLFNEFDFLDRFDEAKKIGFKAIEFQFPYSYDANQIKRKLDKHNLSISIFNSSPGNLDGGDRGLACIFERKEEFNKSILEALDYAQIINGKKIHVMSGILKDPKDHDLSVNTYIDNLKWACDKAEEFGIQILIEPINQRNIPNYFLSSADMAVQIIEEINKPNLKLLFDVFHHQIINGDVSKSIEKFIYFIGHIQIAGIPDRHEPDISEIDYNYILNIIEKNGYNGWIGCEYNPKNGTISGMKWINNFQKYLF